MNKAELADAVAAQTGGDKGVMTSAIDAVFDQITDALKRREKVSITGFGNFEARYSAARTARNPRTGEPVDVAARYSPKFKAGKGLKDSVA